MENNDRDQVRGEETDRPLTDAEVEALTAGLSQAEIDELAAAHRKAAGEPEPPAEKKAAGSHWSLGLAIGLCLGALIGKVAFDDLGGGMTIGAVLGMGVGMYLKRKP
ncbi:hypothetical protein [Pseudoflavonifractor phocaeensis]|uniref:hypothetical protein n=1 Tax=Pseudoflavonifractor phocaeensis TaxID=1870988 RepID=UPI001955FD7E|nr:hypothetical protein [Pseudoflavonifractor phocaeensis]MBM6870121.1 hypothetical protein [Pseudoflavonifractor phocaeensis]